MAVNNNVAIAVPSVTVDNTILPIMPNSVVYTEGFGEQTVRVQSSGGGSVQQVVSTNLETALSSFKCTVLNTVANINFIRQIKSTGAPHVVTWFDSAVGFTRTMEQAVLVNDYEVNLSSDGNIALEFKGTAAA